MSEHKEGKTGVYATFGKSGKINGGILRNLF